MIPVWRDRDLSILDMFCHPDIDVHTTFLKGVGINIAKQSFESLFAAFPIFNLKVDELIETPGRVTYKWSAEALQNDKILDYDVVPGPLHFNGIVFLVFDEQNMVIKYHSFSNMAQILTSYNNKIPINSENKDILENFVVQLSDIIFLLAKRTNVHLTRREVECLYFWVKGYSIKETARKLGDLSSKTIQVFREGIRKKFAINSYHELLEILHKHKILIHIFDI